MKKIKEFFKKHNLAIIIIMALVFGCAGGLAGGLVAGAYLNNSSFGFLPFGDLDFSSDRYAGQGFIMSNPRNVIVQEDDKISETINSIGSSLVGIYKKKPQTKTSAEAFAPENYYKINEPSGQGFVITSDGWIVTNMALVKNFNDYIVISRDKKIYEIDRAAADYLTKFNFIHVQARDLPVRKFAEPTEIKVGSLALAVNWLGLNSVSRVSGFSESAGLVKSSDGFSKKIVLNSKPAAEFKGSAIFNLAGEALGLVNESGEIEPFSHLTGAIKSLFRNKTVVRPSLGINYINLADLAGQNGVWQKGAIIYRDQKTAAVKKNSPAEKSGLREGDIILAVNDILLNQDNNLTELIEDHLVGETVSLLVSRLGLEKEVRVTLEELK